MIQHYLRLHATLTKPHIKKITNQNHISLVNSEWHGGDPGFISAAHIAYRVVSALNE